MWNPLNIFHMSEVVSLTQYLLAIFPALLVCVALLVSIPRNAPLMRILVHILFFVVARDAMTTHGYWQVSTGGLRFTAPPFVLLALGALSLSLVVGTIRLESEASRKIRWINSSIPFSAVCGIAGAALIVVITLVLKSLFSLPSMSAVATTMLPLLIAFSLAGNLYEELLFRGLLQQYLQTLLTPARAALVSGLLFALCHASLATTVTQIGAPIFVFTLMEGVIAGLVYVRAGLLGAAMTHGLAIFALASGWV